MLAIPLGLRARTKDFPWMTVLLLVATCIYSIMHLSVSRKIEKQVLHDPVSLERYQKQKVLATAACASQFSSDECALLARFAQPLTRESPYATYDRARALKSSDKMFRFLLDREQWLKPSEGVKALPEYAAFVVAVQAEEKVLKAFMRAEGILTRSTFSFADLLRAQFLHGGWMHLIGNMFFFLIFAIPVEQRVGAGAFAAIYFLGGSAGLILQLMTGLGATTPLLGASANVFAIAAAFLVLFWSFAMRVWVSLFFVFNQVVLIPSWIFFATFMLLQEFTGAIRLESDGIGHVAHLGGFMVGAVFAFVAAQAKQLPQGIAFPFELRLLEKANRETDPAPKLKLLQKIIFYNPENRFARDLAWLTLSELSRHPWQALSEQTKFFIEEDLPRKFDDGTALEVLPILSQSDWPWTSFVPAGPKTEAILKEFNLREADEVRATGS